MKFILALWRGEKGLAFTFGVMWFGVTLALVLLLFASLTNSAPKPISIFLLIALGGYEPFIMICVWKRAQERIVQGGISLIAGYLARLIATCGGTYVMVLWSILFSQFELNI